MNISCPNQMFPCMSKEFKTIQSFDGTDNIDNLSHDWLECIECGCNFNRWTCSKERLSEVFGKDVDLYQ